MSEIRSTAAEKPFADRWLVGLVALAALLGLVYNAVLLPGFGPDEPRHLAYVKLLVTEQRLPLLQSDGTSEYAGAHAYHPPLYYLALAPLYALARFLPGDGVYHALRVASLLLCLAALPLLYQIAQRAGGNGDETARRALARLVTAHIALLPIFGMTAGIINNDSALLLAVTAFLWLIAVRYAADYGWQSALVLGLVFGLGALCKATAMLCNGVILLIYAWHQHRAMPSRAARVWARCGVALLVAALVAAPWYVRNIALYGTYQPIPEGFSHPALPAPSSGALVMMMHDNFPPLFRFANWGIFYSLWSQKDWIPETMRGAVYGLLLVYCLLALGGHVKQRLAQRRVAPESTLTSTSQSTFGADAAGAMARRAAYGAFAFNWLSCLWIALFVHFGQAEGGRYLLPSLIGLSLFLARGWNAWLGARRLPWLLAAWCAGCLALNAVAIYWLLAYLNPTFGPKS